MDHANGSRDASEKTKGRKSNACPETIRLSRTKRSQGKMRLGSPDREQHASSSVSARREVSITNSEWLFLGRKGDTANHFKEEVILLETIDRFLEYCLGKGISC